MNQSEVVNKRLKMGRLAPRQLGFGANMKMHLLRGVLSDLGPAPADSPDYVAAVYAQSPAGWGMALNDTYGDCTIASEAHTEMLRTANAGTINIPSDAEIAAVYAAVQGYSGSLTDAAAVTAFLANNDGGAVEAAVIDYLVKTGVDARHLTAAANIDPANLDHIKWAVCLFGSCLLGINIYSQAQDLYEADRPWDYIADATCEGGHAVPVVKYDADGTFWVVTWGKLQAVTTAFMNGVYADGSRYVEEAHAELGFDFIEATGYSPGGFSGTQLIADLQAVSQQ